MTRREADIFACLVDTFVAPARPLPAVRETDAVASFEDYLRYSPAAGRIALRGLLLVLETAPRLLGFGGRLRRLDGAGRAAFLERVDATPLAPGLAALRSLAHASYYGDAGVMRLLGYDAGARVARGRALRAAEARW